MEFWRVTPRELHALLERHREREKLANYRAGLAAAASYNVHRAKRQDRLIEPLDFFGTGRPRRGRTATEITHTMKQLAALMEQRKRGR